MLLLKKDGASRPRSKLPHGSLARHTARLLGAAAATVENGQKPGDEKDGVNCTSS